MIPFEVETLDENSGHCDCCGTRTRSVWGLIHDGPLACAAYWVSWTEGHLQDVGANIDFVIGAWGDTTGPGDRCSVSLVYRQPPKGGFMVVDAGLKPTLAATALTRQEIIDTPLADHIFRLVDAIWLQDSRLDELTWAKTS